MNKKNNDYVYAVARIRCKESKLLSSAQIEQLTAMKDSQSVERFVLDNGWISPVDSDDTDIFLLQQKELWKLMKELVGDLSVFDFLRIQNDFHNLKAAVKAVYSNSKPSFVFLTGGVLDSEIVYNAVKNKDYANLPDFLIKPLQDAEKTLLQTGDGQLCDFIIDKACVETVYNLGKCSNDSIIRAYCELFSVSANIKIAIRGTKLNKSSDSILSIMPFCDSIDSKALAKSAANGFDDICDYLLSTDYKSSVPAIKESLSAFEKWCDDFIMSKLRECKSDPFTIGPLVAYIFAKEAEIKNVRLIMMAKLNELDDSIIRERLRDTYV